MNNQNLKSAVMKNITKSAVLLAALSAASAAFGADLPLRMPPPPPPPPPLWSGLYFGLNAGGLWANNTTVNSSAWGLYNDPLRSFYTGDLAAATATGPINGGNNSGLAGGGQVGFNWQMRGTISSRVVAGVEADIQGLATGNSQGSFFGAASSPNFSDPHSSGSNRFSPITIATSYKSLNYIGTARGRLGFLLTPTLLVYGTGGLAYGGVNLNVSYATADAGPVAAPSYTTFGNSFGAIAYSKTQVGWTAGGGIEWMFLPDLSAKFEYLYYDLGRVTGATALVGGSNNNFGRDLTPRTGYGYAAYAATRFNGNIVRAGVNYHMNWWAAPPIVPYL
jgi:outer membrane immunogenic protein